MQALSFAVDAKVRELFGGYRYSIVPFSYKTHSNSRFDRINDVAYLDPSDIEYPFHLNPLEIKSSVYKELISSGIVSIFYKLYAHSWGPRLEYILRKRKRAAWKGEI
jgi:hypothetical protein